MKKEKWTMLEFRKRIATSVKNPEITGDIHFEELLEVLYKPGLCGLDFADIVEAVKNRYATITCCEYANIDDFKSSIGKEFDYNSKAVILAVKVQCSENGLDAVREIAETVAVSVNSDAQLLWQAVYRKRNMLRVILLEVR
jgi:ribosome-interacting GTPase 1